MTKGSPIAELVSIHAPRAGRDMCGTISTACGPCFNPRAPCGARPRHPRKYVYCRHVSIHAPRAGRDPRRPMCSTCSIRFNPRAPCGARPIPSSTTRDARSFNPRAPCGARQYQDLFQAVMQAFQSTRPVRGATEFKIAAVGRAIVSIHAPRAGRDCERRSLRQSLRRFNPRAPCGARQRQGSHRWYTRSFNPRAPCGARHRQLSGMVRIPSVSIHAPRAGRDDTALCGGRKRHGFNPRAPCGARHALSSSRFASGCFNPRAPCGARLVIFSIHP